MQSNRNLTLLILGLLIIILSSVGCYQSNQTALRIGINAWPGYEFLYLAKVKGFFKELGINVQLVEFSSLSDARRAFERNQIDGLGTTLVEVLQSRDKSDRLLTIVKAVDYSHGGDLVISSSKLKSGLDLKGAKVGVELSSVGIYILARALEKFNLRLSDINIISSDQLTMEEDFARNKLDAVVTYPPTSIRILKNHDANTLFTSKEIPGEVIDVIAVDKSLLENRRKEVIQLLDAFDKAVEYSKNNQQEAYSIMAEREGISPEEFKYALENEIKMISPGEQHEYFEKNGKLSLAIQKADKVLRESKQLRMPKSNHEIFVNLENK